MRFTFEALGDTLGDTLAASLAGTNARAEGLSRGAGLATAILGGDILRSG
jgi:hypothetical protein